MKKFPKCVAYGEVVEFEKKLFYIFILRYQEASS